MYQKNKIIIGMLISMVVWVIGFYLVFDKNSLNILNERIQTLPKQTKPLNECFNDFIEIIMNNLTVAFILSFLGYLSFGVISLFGSFYNGFIFAIYINAFFYKYNSDLIYKVMIHAPSEFFSLCFFGAVGLGGFGNYKRVSNNELSTFFDNLPPTKYYIIPILLLIFSAIIESDLLFAFF